jgi:hypothetical protein
MTADADPIAPLFGEDYLSALLLAMVIEHCAAYSPTARRRMTSYFNTHDASPDRHDWLDSYNIPANADAMRELDGSEIEITEQDGAHVIAKVTPEGHALLDRLRAERERERGAKPDTYVVLNPLPPSRIEWLKRQSLRVAAVFRLSKSKPG